MEPLYPPLPATAPLRGIHEMPPVPWWPPAPGWWLVGLAMIAVGLLLWRWRAPLSLRIPIPGVTLGTWRWEAARSLRALRHRIDRGQDPRAVLRDLSELLRRIAMARLGRESCAGLEGAAWLAWLTRHDPRGFSWTEHARLLIRGPYAPPHSPAGGCDVGEVRGLIDAACAWVALPHARDREGWRAWRPWPALTRRLGHGAPRDPAS